MATTAEAAAHLFLSTARFHELIGQGVITKPEGRGQHDLNKVREQYIRHIRAKFHGAGKGDNDGLSKARADLAREQTSAVALKNAVARGDFVALASVRRGLEMVFSAFRERMLAIPGKIASSCEMRERSEIEEIVRDELNECLDELNRPIVADTGDDAGSAAGDLEDDRGGSEDSEATAEALAD